MKANTVLKVTPETPLLLRRIQQKPKVQYPIVNHMTIVTTPGYKPEMNDQQDDATRYDRD